MSDQNLLTSTPSSVSTHTFPSAKPAFATHRGWIIAGAAVLVAGIAVAVGWGLMGHGGDDPSLAMSAVAEVRDLEVKAIESGEVEAERRDNIINELKWPVYIKTLMSDGALVKKGDVIIEFDCKELDDAVVQKKIDVDTATAEYTTARENSEMKKKEVDYNVYRGEQTLTDTNEAIKRYKEGDWPTKLNDADGVIEMARRDLTLAQGKLDFKLKANADPELKTPYSASEVEADKLGVDRLKRTLARAITTKAMMEKYDDPQEQRRLGLAIKDAELNLERARLEAKNQVLIAKTTEEAKKHTLDTQTDKLNDLLNDQKKLVVKAARDALVVYNTRWNGQQVQVESGAKIEPRQLVMIIPDMTSLQIKTRVYESVISDVAPGAQATVTLDWMRGTPMPGKVVRVAPLPDQQNWWNPTVKVFNVYIKLDSLPEGIKPNMTARVEVQLARLQNVLTVPAAAVFSRGTSKFCYRTVNNRGELAPITVGKMNETHVQILSGLSAGEKVLLLPPSSNGGDEKKPAPDAGDKEPKKS